MVRSTPPRSLRARNLEFAHRPVEVAGLGVTDEIESQLAGLAQLGELGGRELTYGAVLLADNRTLLAFVDDPPPFLPQQVVDYDLFDRLDVPLRQRTDLAIRSDAGELFEESSSP
ncbi:MAG: hypothetical protein JO057_13810 [Chloroflexi bacterium]|nr:hypothetical protein [Chloroflexota bacterium]